MNEEWISDKARFSYDGLKRRRLDVPMVKRDGKLQPTELARRVRRDPRRGSTACDGRKVAFDRRRSRRLRDHGARAASWPQRLGTPHVDCRQDGAKLDAGARAGYLFNTTIAGIEQADACLLVGTNPRWEAPLVNARLRKRWRQGGFTVGRIGAASRSDLSGRGAGRRAGDAGGAGARRARASPRRCEQAKHADADPRAWARSPGPTVRRAGGWRASSPRRCGMVTRRLERLQRAAHGGRPRRRPRSRPGAGRGRARRGRHPRRRRRPARSRSCS